jgi:hypothetical protein
MKDLNIHYIIQRGATVDILTDLTCSFLYSHETNLDNYQAILVELSAGINNLLHRENVLSDISPQQFIDKLSYRHTLEHILVINLINVIYVVKDLAGINIYKVYHQYVF